MNAGTSISYYDGVLIAIAVSLAAGIVVGVVTEFPLQIGLLIGSLVATVFVYDAIFRNPPRPAPSGGAKVGAIAWHVYLVALLSVPVFCGVRRRHNRARQSDAGLRSRCWVGPSVPRGAHVSYSQPLGIMTAV